MSRSDDEVVGAGCFLLIAVPVTITLIVAFGKTALFVLLCVGAFSTASLLIIWKVGERLAARAAAALLAEQQRVCPVCQSGTGSVILAEFDSADGLCPAHAARWEKIKGLEDEVLDGD